MEEKKDALVLLNDGDVQEEEGSCYSWPVLIDLIECRELSESE